MRQRRQSCRGAYMYPRDTLLRIVAVALLLYSLFSLSAAGAQLRRLSGEAEALSGELALLEAENRELSGKLREGLSREELLRLARERLGLALPGEKIFYFETDREG